MELRHIRAFIVVADELNFRRAAERLHIAQPALSQQIKRLEHEVGVILLHRTTRHVTLTPAGEAFLYQARRALQATLAASEAASQAAAGRTGVVRLGFSGPTSYEALVLVTRNFRESRPQVRLEIVGPVYGGELIERLDRDEIDAGLIRLPVAGTGIQTREITRHAMAVALPEHHALAARKQIGLLDVCDEGIISYPLNRGAALASRIHSAYLEHGLIPKVVQEAPDTHTIMSLVGAGVGVGFVPISASHIKLPGVVLVPVADVPPIPLVLGWRKDDANPALHALIDTVNEVAAEHNESTDPNPTPPEADSRTLSSLQWAHGRPSRR